MDEQEETPDPPQEEPIFATESTLATEPILATESILATEQTTSTSAHKTPVQEELKIDSIRGFSDYDVIAATYLAKEF